MKRCLLVGITVLFMSANASLQEDFAQMDLEQELLLREIRKSSVLIAVEIDEKAPNDKSILPKKFLKIEEKPVVSVPKDDVSIEEKSDVKESNSEDRADVIQKKIMLEAEEKKEVQKLVEEKREALKVEKAMKEAEVKKVKEAKAKEEAKKLELEKREVAAYEKQRAEKLAIKEAQRAEVEKKLLAQKALTEQASEKEKVMDKPSVEGREALTSVASSEEGVALVGDVNVTRDKEEAKISADKAYEEAVKEMSQED